MISLKEMITPVPYQITVRTKLAEVLNIMKETKWSLLPVVDEETKLVGVFTRSHLYAMILDEKPLTTPIKDYVRKDVSSLRVDTPYEEVEKIVRKSQVGTGVVVDTEEKVLGIFTKADMVMGLLNTTNTLKEQLDTVMENAPIGVIMTDEYSKIIYANKRLYEITGISRERLYSKKLSKEFPEIEKMMEQTEWNSSFTVSRIKSILNISTYQTVRNEKGYIILFQDISEIEGIASELELVKNLKQSLQTAIDHAYDGILMTDAQQNIQMVSPSLLELFDLEYSEVIHKKTDKVFPQFQLSKVFSTEAPEVSDFQEIIGIKYIIHRIPIIQDGRMVGAIGKIMYRQLNEVSELFKKLQKAENKASFYHTELKKSEAARYTWDHIISENPVMETIKKSAAKAAKGRSTILIRGESGTGKELFAHASHNSSARKDGKFIVVNCAAIPEELLESEFFGYEEGAFTGARTRGKIGKFDLANGGTLFLDEIGDMSLTLQAKLLRVLQEKEFYRVGGTKRVQVDVRIIAATNRNLEEMVREGMFREDLYYRLNVISLFIPPLRDRLKDVELLSKRMMCELNSMIGTSITGFEPQANQMLFSYHWPGNVRELRNVMERAMTFAEHGKIKVEDLPDYMFGSRESMREIAVTEEESMVESAERHAIETALTKTKGNKAKAAKMLGISRSSLYDKLKKYQLN
ncbi:diguanylate cyclase [Bacillus sp. LL01]|uniref:sigma-54-dependent Fis family transcriptional regulator n=1 Tax=Bacillus sp. LL01 TaxID=1665556 RepID=UPI00064D03B5|nr:sigma-54-dependent Fis family transcriptional regulator [Bacillus sp. LL01]KMJ58376.1 diguanylate cyclase [Bacillus sp. LL01]